VAKYTRRLLVEDLNILLLWWCFEAYKMTCDLHHPKNIVAKIGKLTHI
jgi:hypothetical protein